jgi:hypothetical protein
MSEREESTEAFDPNSLNPPPSNQDYVTINQEREEEEEESLFVSERESDTDSEDSGEESAQVPGDDRAADEDYDDTQASSNWFPDDDQLFPEKEWAQRRLDHIREDPQYQELAADWELLQSEIDAKRVASTKMVTFEEGRVWPYVNNHLRFLAELVVQAYIKDVLKAVGVNHKKPAKRPPGAHRLPQAVLEGRRGLCWQTFYTLLNAEDSGTQQPDLVSPRLLPQRRFDETDERYEYVLARRYRPKDVQLRKPSVATAYTPYRPNLSNKRNQIKTIGSEKKQEEVLWVEKLTELFFIEDKLMTDPKERIKIRVWDEKPGTFRNKTRCLIELLEESFEDGERLADYWNQNLARLASRYLWAVPYFGKENIGEPAAIVWTKDHWTFRNIRIMVPALSLELTEKTRRNISIRESLFKEEARMLFHNPIKREGEDDDNDIRTPTRNLPVTPNRGPPITNRSSPMSNERIIQAIRNNDDLEPNIRERLLKEARDIFYNPINLFDVLQSKASIAIRHHIRLDPMCPINSGEGASTIGLEGRNQQSVINHVIALYTSLSSGEADDIAQKLVNAIKSMGPKLRCMQENKVPIISFDESQGGLIGTCRNFGVPLFPVFGNALHLTTIDEYVAASLLQSRDNRHGMDDGVNVHSPIVIDGSTSEVEDTAETPALKRRRVTRSSVNNRRQSSVLTTHTDDNITEIRAEDVETGTDIGFEDTGTNVE